LGDLVPLEMKHCGTACYSRYSVVLVTKSTSMMKLLYSKILQVSGDRTISCHQHYLCFITQC